MYECSNCGHIMSYPLDRCPGCGALLSGVKCQNCGYAAAKSVFINNNHRCPKCGSVVNTGDCFVATAVFGDYGCSEVLELRNFRDQFLVNSWFGRKFIDFYYKNGPSWAKAIKDRLLFKSFIKLFLKLLVLHLP